MASKQSLRLSSSANKFRNYFKISVKIEATEEVFPLKKIYNEMKISELKGYMEFITGIPVDLQRLSYLDEGDLLDDSDIKSNDIVAGGTLLMRIWNQWVELVEAVVFNDLDWVFSLGITEDTTFKTANTQYMSQRARKQWFKKRADVALLIAAHRGHTAMISILIDSAKADVNATTPLGRTALHLASSQGKGSMIDALLSKGANIDAEDAEGHSPLSIANMFNHKNCERHLFQFRWQERANKVVPSQDIPLKAHQYKDSKFPLWLKGSKAQLYFTKILPPQEFQSTDFSSPKHSDPQGAIKREQLRKLKEMEEKEGLTETKELKETAGESETVPLVCVRSSESSRPPTHDEWLSKIKNRERKFIESKKKEKKKEKLEEEEKKQDELERSNTYEAWLAQKEIDKKQQTTSQRDRLPAINTQDNLISINRENVGALRSYLRSLGNDRSGQPYEDWLNKKVTEILNT